VSKGRVVAIERARIERLAAEIAEPITVGQGSVTRLVSSVGDVDEWRRAARRAGRILNVPVRTGVAPDGSKVWAVDNS
jgi:hypothetical protein